MRRCSSASFGSGTTMNRISRAIPSDDLRNPNSGAGLADTADRDVPLRFGKRNTNRSAAEMNFICLLLNLVTITVAMLAPAQGFERFVKIRKLVHWIHGCRHDPARLVDNKNSAFAGASVRFSLAKHAVLAADLSMRPEIARHQKVEGADFTLPCRRIHNVIHADGHRLGLTQREFLAFQLISN